VAAVEALMDAKAGAPEFESYAVFDPKVRETGLDRVQSGQSCLITRELILLLIW
jgi:hypothetical protein